MFRGEDYQHLPPSAQKYLTHSIREGAPLASSVLLHMTGEIKLKEWLPFTATQVVNGDHGFIWKARAKRGFAFISGFDQCIDGVGEMRWKLLGLFPVMTGTGPDISRSAAGRFAIERGLLPSSLCRPDAEFSGDENLISVKAPGVQEISIGINATGRVGSVSMLRWGNPDGGASKLHPFGGFVDEEATFGDYTIPTRLRVGWGFGSDAYKEGEFFRCTITDAEFRS